MVRDIWWALVNLALWLKSSGYCEEHLVGTGECGGMGCNERLYRWTVVGNW